MLEITARCERDGQISRHRLPLNEVVVLGREAKDWSIPWEPWLSRRHVEIRMEKGQVQVSRLSQAQNPVMFRGRPAETFLLRPGDCFVIGETVFTLSSKSDSVNSDSEPLINSFSIGHEELRQVAFRDAPHRLDVLGRLSKIIFSVSEESELYAQTIDLLMEGIRKANLIAVVKIDSQTSEHVSILHVDSRMIREGRFQPSRRLCQEAILQLKQSVVHIWANRERSSTEAYTLVGNFDWAFCTPLQGDTCKGLGIYVAGSLSETSPATLMTKSVSNDLSEDVKFCELVTTIVSALREMQTLQHRQSVLRHFFSPSVLRVLFAADPEKALQPRESDISVLFCDLRGFSRKIEIASENLPAILDRLSEALDVMSKCILSHNGAIADFLGDCAIGFWGWPLAQPNDVEQACAAALEIQSAFGAFAQQPNHPLYGFQVGVGLGTGRALAGQIGSRDQAKVTVMGPVVNLASRLEGLTKLLRVPILIDEPTAQVVANKMPTTKARRRSLARIKPYGLEIPLLVSELLPPISENSLLTEMHLNHYQSALENFLAGRWREAYEELHLLPPEDRGKDLLLSFILKHNHTPPADWDGVITMQSKN